LFVFRPWWRERIYFDVRNARVVRAEPELDAVAKTIEHRIILSEIQAAANSADIDDPSENDLRAAYLSGVLKIQESVPFLRVLESSTYWSGVSVGGSDQLRDGDVDPMNYWTYDMRMITKTSLRRLGEVPRHFDAFEFEQIDGNNSAKFAIPALEGTRSENVANVKLGMSAKYVLTLLGAPDFVSYRKWVYDMDTNSPYSLILKFDARSVKQINRRQPPTWKTSLTRDDKMINF